MLTVTSIKYIGLGSFVMVQEGRVFIKMKSLQIDVVNDSPYIPMSDIATETARALLLGGY